MPGELVGEFVGAYGISIWRINGGDSDGTATRRHNSFKVACMVVAVAARQSRCDVLQRPFRENGNAVVGFLAMDGAIVSEFLECLRRKGLIGAFDLLKTDNVGRGFL